MYLQQTLWTQEKKGKSRLLFSGVHYRINISFISDLILWTSDKLQKLHYISDAYLCKGKSSLCRNKIRWYRLCQFLNTQPEIKITFLVCFKVFASVSHQLGKLSQTTPVTIQLNTMLFPWNQCVHCPFIADHSKVSQKLWITTWLINWQFNQYINLKVVNSMQLRVPLIILSLCIKMYPAISIYINCYCHSPQ